MNEHNWLKRFRQYGYEIDVFDKYRDAVARYNRSALKVLGVAGALAGLVSLIVMLLKGKTGAVFFAALMLAAGIGGFVVARIRDVDRRVVQAAGYVLCVAFYALAIVGNVQFGHDGADAFWVGVNMAMSCYLLYYSTHLLGMQLISFLALVIACDQQGGFPSDRLIICAIFLAAGMITVYALGRARIGLIMSREVTKKQADTDLLTGLMIRNAAQLEVESHLEESSESGVLMLLDLDRFKSVNDRLGHQMGDKVLIDVAADLKKMFRNTDVLSRLGGDEFIVYMKAVPEKGWAEQRAEQVVREVRRWVGDGTTNIQVTASVGVVMTDNVDRTYDDLYRAADIAMYFAKAQGGNQAIFYSKDLLNQARGKATTREDETAGMAEQNGKNGEDLR